MQKKFDLVQSARKGEQAIRKRMFGYIAAGLGLVAGLAWNDAIRAVIEQVLPAGNTVIAKIIFAAVLTVLVGVILSYMEKKSS